ncbi:STAS domain-containing protein [Neobacillus piezotolerans]|uniref:STAS domain-containing protein n=1 Tax=Neobacillus piezotolerans TaxID=2259171 RepID=A0A3D8GRZ1_9BACI|nr:STAS domain-containing protein [Neobacillus piezotolerans]RDU37208.1 STAS domain-containing protein [Neobacillus piezotolerans]
MSDRLALLGEAIVNNKYDIAEEVHNIRFSKLQLTPEQKREFQKIEQQIMQVRADFIEIFGRALIDNNDEQLSIDRVKEWGERAGSFIFNLGAPLDEALKDSSDYRKVIWKFIQESNSDMDLSADCIFKIISIIDPLLDHAVYYFSLTFVHHFQQSLNNAKKAFMELSVPIVPLIPGVGVLPLIGNIDTERAALLMEKTLEQANKLNLQHLILDVSGVLIIDTMVADQLLRVISALSLIGVKTILTGIRPEVAQTIVSLGLSLNQLTVKSNLHQAFKELQLVRQ